MPQSLYKIAEECRMRLDKIDMQTLVEAVKNAYGSVVAKAWYENRAADTSQVDGVFLYTFKDIDPQEDESTGMWYINIPSSYLRLPHELGINWVSFMKDRRDFLRIDNVGIWSNLKAFALGGRQCYMVEGPKMTFPKMTQANAGPILLKLAVGLDDVNDREELNIPRNIADQIIDMVVARFSPAPNKKPETLV